MEKEGRTRAPNFSPFEIEMLIDLVHKYKSVIENKKTDGVSIKEKDTTWRKISEEFSSLPGVTQRTPANLKTAYENLKRKARRDAANDKLETYRTGGGSAGPKKLDSVGEKILGIISPSVRIQSRYDSDAGYGEPSTSLDQTSTTISAPLPMTSNLDAGYGEPSTSLDQTSTTISAPLPMASNLDAGYGGPSTSQDHRYCAVPVTMRNRWDAEYGEPSTSQDHRYCAVPVTMRRIPSPVQVLEEIVIGDFTGPASVECDDTTHRSSQPVTPTILKRKRHSVDTVEDGAKRSKASAADSITQAAETQRRALQRELQLKEEDHETLMEIRREKLKLLKIKQEVALEKRKFWRTRNANAESNL